MIIRKICAGLVLFLAGFSCEAQGDTLVPFGSEWRYRIGTTEASSPSNAWRRVGFADQSWPSGTAPFGYGEPEVVTGLPSSAEANYLSVYFRRAFAIPNPASISQLDLVVRIDDACVAWINGTEVLRHNLPSGDLPFDAAGVSANEPVTQSVTLTNNPSALLVPGNNILAVHVFNANRTSSDLLFDAQLTSTSDTTAPIVVERVPQPGATVRELKQIQVIFSESVTGVDAADLLVNAAPSPGVSAVSPREYIFSFAEPPTGVVQLAWAANHGIRDLATPPNAFTGGTWACTLDPSAPPPTVMISEFLADNSGGIRDDFGIRSDWIELFNPGAEAVNLEGWSLTDDPTRLEKWSFPRTVLGPNGYLVVWASELDRRVAGAPLHTNFKLSSGGEYLALLDAETHIVSEFAPAYPSQETNISFGRDRVDPTLTGYFSTPTPGQPNASSGPGFAPEPVFSVPSGTFPDNTLTVTITAPAGQIHYTLDGSVPTQASQVYSQPLVLTASTILQARVFQSNLLPSAPVIRTYTLLGSGFGDFSSNLPVMIIQTGGQGIPMDQRVRAFVTVFEPHDGRARLANAPDFESAVAIEVRGQTSSGFPKQPYNLEIQDPFGNDLEVPLLGLPEESDWVLHNPYSDKCLMNNVLAFELHEKMGHYAPRCRFVEVFVKTSRTRLSYPGDYRGVYVLMEKIKIDGNRVDLERLGPGHNQEPEITGGYIIKKDKDSPGDLNFSTRGGSQFSGQALKFHDPKPDEITGPQRDWIVRYLNQFESALYASDWLRRTGTNHYSHFIDADSFVDYHWIVEFTKQIDGYRLSNYMSKDRGEKLRMEPIWDWNLAWGNADYLEGEFTNGWYYPLIGNAEHLWLRRLISGTPNGYDKQGDPDFNQRIIDRWSVLRTNILNASNVTARVNEIAALLDEAQARDFAKYPRLSTYVWPNPRFYIAPTYSAIIDAMKRWINGRFHWIDGQFIKAPQLGRGPGPIEPGSLLSLSAPAGSILYTLDGTDPRLTGGAVSPAARWYSSALSVDQNIRVFARARTGTNWSGPAIGTFVVQTPPLVVTELMFEPAPSHPGDTNSESFEFLELRNIGTHALDLSGFRFTAGIQYQFGTTSAVTRLAPGEYVVLVKDKAAFGARYPDAVGSVAGEFRGNLDNRGEQLVLEGPLQEPILDFSYSEEWIPIAAGAGFSLVIMDDHAPRASWDNPASWRRSGREGGSPGREDPAPSPVMPVLVNEVLSSPLPPDVDAIELLNPGPASVNIGGWFLTDDFTTPRKFRIPDETTVPAGGYLLFDRGVFDVAGGFALSATGDETYLFGAAAGVLNGYVHGFGFDTADPGVSFGLYKTSTGEERFVSQTRPTLGSANAGPRVGPVVINEIMFRPPQTGTNETALEEYIELLNITTEPVAFFDPAAPTHTWRMRGGADYDFPEDVTLPAGGYALLVNFDPADAAALGHFRAAYGVPATVLVFGPYRGKLNNRGERVTLAKHAASLEGTVLEPAFVTVDEVHYASSAPWPEGANGTGQSLQRIVSSRFGDDPANWLAASPTPGTANPSPVGDSDADGLPDSWETAHFGTLETNPDEDPDLDGMTNAQEFVAGTDPTNPASALEAVMISSGIGTLRLQFEARDGRDYALFSADRVDGPWHKVADLPIAAPGPVAFAIEASGERQFYRLVVSSP